MLNSLQRNMPVHQGTHFARACVRSHEGFTSGKHWWEVVTAGEVWSLGLVKESVYSRNLFPDFNCMPWLIKNCVWPDCPYTFISHPEFKTIIGILLDYEKGMVIFYDGNGIIITVFTTSFSGEKIYPVFCLGDGPLQLFPAGESFKWFTTIYNSNV